MRGGITWPTATAVCKLTVMHLSIASPGVHPGRPRGFDRLALPGGGEFDHEVGSGGGGGRREAH